jgi:hypothetical protein
VRETELSANHDSPLLGPDWNVFQYKQHDVSAGGRGRVFSRLKDELRGPSRAFIGEGVGSPRGMCW